MLNTKLFSIPHISAFATLALVAAFAGCSSDSDPPASGTGGSGNTGGSGTTGGGGSSTTGGAASGLQGNFNVDLKEEDMFTGFLGIIYDGPSPPTIALKSDGKSGECELLIPWAPFCSGCGTSICTADNTCTPYPNKKDAGTITVTGLGPELSLTAMALNYQPSMTLPFPACAEGDAVSVKSSTFSMTTKCVLPLKLTSPVPVPVLKSKTVDLTWNAAAAGTGSRIYIHLDIAHHGGKKGEINCDVADTGSFSIPEPLVTKLVNLGLAGFPTIGITRYTSVGDASNPNIKLKVSSFVEKAVDTGIVSCTEQEQCPTGKMCDTADKVCK